MDFGKTKLSRRNYSPHCIKYGFSEDKPILCVHHNVLCVVNYWLLRLKHSNYADKPNEVFSTMFVSCIRLVNHNSAV